MKTIKYISSFLLILLVIIAICVFTFRAQLIKHFSPTVQQIGYIHIVVKNDTSYVSAKLVVQNNSFLKIEIDSIYYQITLFDKTYLKSKNTLHIYMPKYGNDTIDFSLKIPFAAIIKDLKIERKKGDSTSYSVDISLQYTTIFGKAEHPIHRTAKLKIPQPPELKIVNIKWTKVRLKSIRALAKIKIINYSPVTLTIKNMHYSVTILKQGYLNGNYTKPIIIQPKATTFIELPLKINVKHIGKTLFHILINKDCYNYTLTLNASMESFGPIQETFKIDLTKNGILELKK